MARAGLGVMSWCGHGTGSVGGVGFFCCVVICSCRLAEVRSFVRRSSCLLSALVRGVCSLLSSVWVFGCAIGQMVSASSCYAFNIVMTSFAALSMWASVVLVEGVISVRYLEAFRWASCVDALPSWYRSMSGLGIGRRNEGWLRVVGMEGVEAVGWDDMSQMLGMFMVRARGLLWLVSEVVTVSSAG